MKKILSILFGVMLTIVAASGYAVTDITGKTLSENAGVAAANSWATLATNTSYNCLAWPDSDKLIIGVNVTARTGNTYETINISAGDNPPAFRSAIGPLSVAIPHAGVYWIGPLESARFVNSTGYLELQGNNLAGKVTYLRVP